MIYLAAVVVPSVLVFIIVGYVQGQQAKEDSKKAAELYQQIVHVLEANPTDPKSHALVWELFCRMIKPNGFVFIGPLYRLALDTMAQHPESIPCRVFALEAGRTYLGSRRPDGRVTTYDEQAIQNDILARSAVVPQIGMAAS